MQVFYARHEKDGETETESETKRGREGGIESIIAQVTQETLPPVMRKILISGLGVN